MRSKIAATLNGVLLKSEPNNIADQETGEVTQMTRFDLLLDCYVEELQQVFPFQKLPPNVSNFQMYVMNTDLDKMSFFSGLPQNVPHVFQVVPMGKSNGKSGISGLKLDFVSATPHK